MTDTALVLSTQSGMSVDLPVKPMYAIIRGEILLCLEDAANTLKTCNEPKKEARHVSIISPYTILLPCKRCGQEKLHRSLGFNISTVCLDCLASLPDVPDGMKRCPTCLESKPFSAFHQNKGRCHGWCKQCKSDWLKERYDPDKKRDENLRKNHGITAYEYDMIFFQQAGLCAICKQPEHIIDPYTKQPKSLAVDHDHRSDEVRQLLCHYCNILLGAYENDIRRMKAVIHYARKHLT